MNLIILILPSLVYSRVGILNVYYTGFHCNTNSSYPVFQDSLIPYSELFSLVLRWQSHEKHWMDGDFRALDPQFIDSETEVLAR